ncbi:MAG TPA: hypothetical protein DD001_07015 [Microcoleaceae bacterium UBA10368]|nr:hypothetical protein [Microcoleaceae cyanobacterium UBA10368]
MTIKARSPLAPLKKGGTRLFSKSTPTPLLKGDLGGSRLGIKPIFLKGFSLKFTGFDRWPILILRQLRTRQCRFPNPTLKVKPSQRILFDD